MIEKDFPLHVAKGVIYALGTLVVLWVYQRWGVEAAVVVGPALGALAYEGNQWIRKQGHPSPRDWLADVIGGCFVALVVSQVL